MSSPSLRNRDGNYPSSSSIAEPTSLVAALNEAQENNARGPNNSTVSSTLDATSPTFHPTSSARVDPAVRGPQNFHPAAQSFGTPRSLSSGQYHPNRTPRRPPSPPSHQDISYRLGLRYSQPPSGHNSKDPVSLERQRRLRKETSSNMTQILEALKPSTSHPETTKDAMLHPSQSQKSPSRKEDYFPPSPSAPNNQPSTSSASSQSPLRPISSTKPTGPSQLKPEVVIYRSYWPPPVKSTQNVPSASATPAIVPRSSQLRAPASDKSRSEVIVISDNEGNSNRRGDDDENDDQSETTSAIQSQRIRLSMDKSEALATTPPTEHSIVPATTSYRTDQAKPDKATSRPLEPRGRPNATVKKLTFGSAANGGLKRIRPPTPVLGESDDDDDDESQASPRPKPRNASLSPIRRSSRPQVYVDVPPLERHLRHQDYRPINSIGSGVAEVLETLEKALRFEEPLPAAVDALRRRLYDMGYRVLLPGQQCDECGALRGSVESKKRKSSAEILEKGPAPARKRGRPPKRRKDHEHDTMTDDGGVAGSINRALQENNATIWRGFLGDPEGGGFRDEPVATRSRTAAASRSSASRITAMSSPALSTNTDAVPREDAQTAIPNEDAVGSSTVDARKEKKQEGSVKGKGRAHQPRTAAQASSSNKIPAALGDGIQPASSKQLTRRRREVPALQKVLDHTPLELSSEKEIIPMSNECAVLSWGHEWTWLEGYYRRQSLPEGPGGIFFAAAPRFGPRVSVDLSDGDEDLDEVAPHLKCCDIVVGRGEPFVDEDRDGPDQYEFDEQLLWDQMTNYLPGDHEFGTNMRDDLLGSPFFQQQHSHPAQNDDLFGSLVPRDLHVPSPMVTPSTEQADPDEMSQFLAFPSDDGSSSGGAQPITAVENGTGNTPFNAASSLESVNSPMPSYGIGSMPYGPSASTWHSRNSFHVDAEPSFASYSKELDVDSTPPFQTVAPSALMSMSSNEEHSVLSSKPAKDAKKTKTARERGKARQRSMSPTSVPRVEASIFTSADLPDTVRPKRVHKPSARVVEMQDRFAELEKMMASTSSLSDESSSDSEVVSKAATTSKKIGPPKKSTSSYAHLRGFVWEQDLDLTPYSCHQCRRKSQRILMRCIKCRCAFCVKCVTTRYPDFTFDRNASWTCFRCTGRCNCTACCLNKKQTYVPGDLRNIGPRIPFVVPESLKQANKKWANLYDLDGSPMGVGYIPEQGSQGYIRMKPLNQTLSSKDEDKDLESSTEDDANSRPSGGHSASATGSSALPSAAGSTMTRDDSPLSPLTSRESSVEAPSLVGKPTRRIIHSPLPLPTPASPRAGGSAGPRGEAKKEVSRRRSPSSAAKSSGMKRLSHHDNHNNYDTDTLNHQHRIFVGRYEPSWGKRIFRNRKTGKRREVTPESWPIEHEETKSGGIWYVGKRPSVHAIRKWGEMKKQYWIDDEGDSDGSDTRDLSFDNRRPPKQTHSSLLDEDEEAAVEAACLDLTPTTSFPSRRIGEDVKTFTSGTDVLGTGPKEPEPPSPLRHVHLTALLQKLGIDL